MRYAVLFLRRTLSLDNSAFSGCEKSKQLTINAFGITTCLPPSAHSIRNGTIVEISNLTKGDLSPILLNMRRRSKCRQLVIFMESLLLCICAIKSTIPRMCTLLHKTSMPPFLISPSELMEGEFPPKAKLLVKEFIMKYQKELLEMWETEQYKKLPPLS